MAEETTNEESGITRTIGNVLRTNYLPKYIEEFAPLNLLGIKDQPFKATEKVDLQSDQRELTAPEKEAGFVQGMDVEKIDKNIQETTTPRKIITTGQLLKAELPYAELKTLPGMTDELYQAINETQYNNAIGFYKLLKAGQGDNENIPAYAKRDLANLDLLLKNEQAYEVEKTPEYAIPFRITNEQGESVIDPEYSKRTFGMRNPYHRLSDNRENFKNFMLDLDMGDQPEVMNTLLTHFATGDLPRALANRTKDLTGGVTSFGVLLGQVARDAGLAVAGFGDRREDKNYFQNIVNSFASASETRVQNRKKFMDDLKDNSFLSSHTARINDFIADKYIEENGEEAYNSLSEVQKQELRVQPEEARAILDFATSELGPLETIALFVAENTGTNFLVNRGARGVGFFTGRDSNEAAFIKANTSRAKFKLEDGSNPYLFSSTRDFVEYTEKARKNESVWSNLWLSLTFNTTRKVAKVESGFYGLAGSERKRRNFGLGKPVKNAKNLYEKAYKTLQRLKRDGASKGDILAAEGRLDKATDNYLLATSKTLPDNPLFIPREHIRRIIGDEITPSIAQGITYEMMTGPDSTPEDLLYAEMWAMGGYLAPALGVHKLALYAGNTITGIIPVADDVIFEVKRFLQNSTIVSRVGLKNIMDQDLLDLKVDGREIRMDEYRAIMDMKTKFQRLDPETQTFILDQGKKFDTYLDTIVGGIKTSNPELADQIKNNLKVNFAQMSGISYFQALARKTTGAMALRDITKVTPKFNEAIKQFRQGEKALALYSDTVNQLDALFTQATKEGNLDAAQQASMQAVLDMQALTLKNLKNQEVTQKEIIEKTYKSIEETLDDPATFIGKTGEEIDTLVNDVINSRLILDEDVGDVKVNFFEKNKDAMESIMKTYNLAIVGLNKALKEYSPKLDGGEALKTIITSKKKLINSRNQRLGNQIYSPLATFKSVDSTDLFSEIINLHKTDSGVTGGEDYLLSAFTPQGKFARSSEGRNFTKSLDKLAYDSMLGVFLKAGDGEPTKEAIRTAADTLEEFLNTDEVYMAVKKKYRLTDTQSPSNVHFYDFLKSSGIKIKGEHELAPIQVSFEDLEYMYRFARDKARAFKSRGDSGAETAYSRLTEKVDNFIMQQGAEVKVTLPDGTTATIADAIKNMRVRWELEVGNRQGKNTFFGRAEKLEGDISQAQRETLLDSVTGLEFLKALYSPNQTDKLKAARNFKEYFAKEFGTPEYPSQFTDKNGNLQKGLDFDAVYDQSSGATIREYISANTKYTFDNSTEEGKLGIELAQATLRVLMDEFAAGKFEKIIREGRIPELKTKDIFKKGSGPNISTTRAITESILSNPDGVDYFDPFDAITDLASIETKQGQRTFLDLDEFLDRENNFVRVLQEDDTKREKVNEYVRELKRKTEASQGKRIREESVDLVYTNAILNGSNTLNGDALLEKYIGNIANSLDEEIAPSVVANFKNDLNTVYTYLPDETNIDDLHRVYAGTLFKAIMKKAKTNAKSTDGKTITVLDEPDEALQILEKASTKKIFEELGVDEKHYEALKATLGHMSMTMQAHKSTIGVPDVRSSAYTEAGIISRAFNLARGMVSSEYLIVEAGFRVMRDNDLSIMNFMLNDPKAAELLVKVVSDEKSSKLSYMDATTLADQITAFIIRESGNREERLDLLEYQSGEEEYNVGNIWGTQRFDVERQIQRARTQEQLGRSVETGSTII